MPREEYDGSAGLTPVMIADGSNPNLDAFGRLRVANAHMLLSSVFDYDKRALLWDEETSGTASSTLDTDSRTVALDVDVASGDMIARQTKQYFTYRAGQSQVIVMTGKFNASKTGLRQRVGYFDADNGVFLEDDEGTISMVVRSKSSGSVVDTKVPQSEWSIRYLDGTEPCGITLDLTKCFILLIDLQWLGVGRVRCGFDIDGACYYVHHFEHANEVTTTYMGSATLPCRYEIENTGATAGASQMLQVCSSVLREGGQEEPGTSLSVDNEATAIAATTTLKGMLGLRLKSTHIRNSIQPIGVEVYNADATAVLHWELLLNPTVGGASPVWVDTGASLAAEYSVTAGVTLTGGTRLSSGYVTAAAKGSAQSVADLSEGLNLAANIAATSDQVWLAVRTITGTANAYGVMKYREIR